MSINAWGELAYKVASDFEKEKRKRYNYRDDIGKSFLYCITLSTYSFFWKKYESMEKAFYALVEYMTKLMKALKEWAKQRELVYKIEWWVVLAMDKLGRYVPHVHGFICGNRKRIIYEYLCRKWQKDGLGYGTFITRSDGHKTHGNIHVQTIDDEREYGSWYGWAGWRRYCIYQQDKIKIGEETGKYKGKPMRKRMVGQSYHGGDYLKQKNWETLHQMDKEGKLHSFLTVIRAQAKP